MSKSKQEKVEEVLHLKQEISRLLQNVRDSQAVCEKYTHENNYLQDYIGSVMKSTDMKAVGNQLQEAKNLVSGISNGTTTESMKNTEMK
ncbi:hypothetical protein ACI3LZ_002242 [Candidozyma auris]